MVFIIFVISALVLEGILRHDEAAIQNSKRTQIPHAPSELPPTDTSSVLTLAKAIEQHSQKTPHPLATRLSKPEADIAIGVHHHRKPTGVLWLCHTISVHKNETRRTHVILPVDLVADIDKLVGKRGRSAFITEASPARD